jgi:hypothetical protein
MTAIRVSADNTHPVRHRTAWGALPGKESLTVTAHFGIMEEWGDGIYAGCRTFPISFLPPIGIEFN